MTTSLTRDEARTELVRAITEDDQKMVTHWTRVLADDFEPQHTPSAWNCQEPYDGMTYAQRTCAACKEESAR